MNLVKTISAELVKKTRILKFLGFGKSDIQTAPEASAYGLDSNPIKDMVAVYSPTATKGSAVIIGYINKNQKALPGEFRIFSTDAQGAEKFYVWLRDSGKIEIGGTTNYAVKYKELKEELDKLQENFNKHLIEFNTHTQVVTVTPSGLIAGPPSVPSQETNTSDFSKAKNDKIETIG